MVKECIDLSTSSDGLDDIRITRISDTETRNAEELTTSSSKIDIVSTVVMDSGLGKHGVVFNLRLSQRRTVVRDNDQLALSLTKRFESGLVSQQVLSTLHDKSQAGVDVLHSFLLLFTRHLKGLADIRLQGCTGLYPQICVTFVRANRKFESAEIRWFSYNFENVNNGVEPHLYLLKSSHSTLWI